MRDGRSRVRKRTVAIALVLVAGALFARMYLAQRSAMDVSQYRFRLVALAPVPGKPRTVTLSVELCRRDGRPIPDSVTFDAHVTDNLLVWHNVGSTYDASEAPGKAYAVQTLEIGPLSPRVHWLQIKGTLYRNVRLLRLSEEYELVSLQEVDLGRHPVPGPPPPPTPLQEVALGGTQVPLYPDSLRLQVPAGTASLSYEVPGLPYPSLDVADFYDEWASAHGWDRRAAPKWQEQLQSGSGGHAVVLRRLQATWVERKTGRQLLLVCQHDQTITPVSPSEGMPASPSAEPPMRVTLSLTGGGER